MQFIYTDELKEYMTSKNHKNIIVEVAQSDGSDFEVTELHTHFVSDKQAKLFVSRQGFHEYEAPIGQLLLPNYRLNYEETITFGIRKVLFIHLITVSGISL